MLVDREFFQAQTPVLELNLVKVLGLRGGLFPLRVELIESVAVQGKCLVLALFQFRNGQAPSAT